MRGKPYSAAAAIATALTCALAGPFGAAASPSPTAVGAARAVCGTVAGPAWTYLGKKGTTWSVFANRAPCGFAKTWAARLLRSPRRGVTTHLTGGPPGWSCAPSLNARLVSRGTAGVCNKVNAEEIFTGPQLLWFPAVR
jgi:hypothetical protein